MFDLNTVLSAALQQAVEAATKPLLERIVALEARIEKLDNAYYIDYRVLADRITALENNPAIGVDTTLLARVVALENEESNTLSNAIDNLDGQEWFWEKVSRKAGQAAQAVVEEAIDEHCQNYNHDDYDSLSSTLEDMGDIDDLVKRDELREAVQDLMDSATLTVRL